MYYKELEEMIVKVCSIQVLKTSLEDYGEKHYINMTVTELYKKPSGIYEVGDIYEVFTSISIKGIIPMNTPVRISFYDSGSIAHIERVRD